MYSCESSCQSRLVAANCKQNSLWQQRIQARRRGPRGGTAGRRKGAARVRAVHASPFPSLLRAAPRPRESELGLGRGCRVGWRVNSWRCGRGGWWGWRGGRRRRGSGWRATRRRSRRTASSRCSAARRCTSSRASPPSSASPSCQGPHARRSASAAAAPSSSSGLRSTCYDLSLTPPAPHHRRPHRMRMMTTSTNTSIKVALE